MIIWSTENNALHIKPFIYVKRECIMVSLQEHTDEELAKMPLIKIAKLLMLEEKQELKFSELFTKVASLKGLDETNKKAKIGQFYTDLNADGTFATNGANMWGLKRWYKKKQKEAVTSDTTRIKRRKRKVVKEDDDLDDEFAMINNEIDETIVEYDEEELDIEIEVDEDFDESFDKEAE